VFKWLRPIPPLPPRPAPAGYVPAACWVVGCTEEGLARLDRDVSGLPRDAEVCECHDLAVRFNIQNPQAVGLPRYGSEVAMGSEAAGWIVAGLFLARPASARASRGRGTAGS
jgi:hypothetical protein